MPRPPAKPSKPPKVPVHRPPPPRQVRIIGGAWKRTQLPVLDALGLRPTPDRVRETVFNWITHLRDGNWDNLRCLDLYAGSGALGFEAASRGAQEVVMVDANAAVARQLEAVKDKLRAANVRVLRGDALAAAQSMALRGQRFDLLFLDPPYQMDLLSRTLPLCKALLAPGGLVYTEAAAALPFGAEPGGEGAAASETPDWLRGWKQVRDDHAGMVFYQLLQLDEIGE